jgi:predicted Zn-dependent protease with MMP-like domain
VVPALEAIVAAFSTDTADTDERAEAGERIDSGGEPDYYAVLGVAPTASDDEIRQAFRRLAKLWHPDHYVNAPERLRERSERRMRSVLRAYDALSTPDARQSYDLRRARPTRSGHPSTGAFGYVPNYSNVWPTAARQYYVHHEPAADGPAHTVGGAQGARAGQGNSFAGILGATLCGVIALGLASNVIRNGASDGGGILSAVFTLLFGALAMLFLLDDAGIGRVANAYLEAEPRMASARRQRRPSVRSTTAHPGAPAHRGRRHPPRRKPMPPEPVEEEPFEPQYVEPERDPTPFERMVEEALGRVPAEFHPFMENVVVRVKDEPDEDEIRRMQLRPCTLLLGLYEGVPLTSQGALDHPPQMITIFQRPIEAYCHGDPKRIRHQVRATVLHELAHHFGMDHDAMPAWVK